MAVQVGSHPHHGRGRLAHQPARHQRAVTAVVEHSTPTGRTLMPPGCAPFYAAQLARVPLTVLVPARMGDARTQRSQMAAPPLHRQHAPDRAAVNQLLGLVRGRLPRDRPVDDQLDACRPRCSGHAQSVLQRGGHRLFDHDVNALTRAGLHNRRMLPVLRADDDDVKTLLRKHRTVVVVRLRHPQVLKCMTQIPGARIVRLAQLRRQGRRVGAGCQLRLRMRRKTFQKMVDMHVGEADSADAVCLCHTVSSTKTVAPVSLPPQQVRTSSAAAAPAPTRPNGTRRRKSR